MMKPTRRSLAGRSISCCALLLLLLLAVVAVALFFILANNSSRQAKQAGAGLASASPGTTALVSTPGNSPGWYQLFFTRPIYPDTPAKRGDAPVVDRFVELLNSAQSSIDLAIYQFDLPTATQALVEAKKRGVQVRMVTDTDSLTASDADMSKAYSSLKAAGIPIVADGRSAIMHDKFAIVDGRWLWTGSWNFTMGDTYRLNNNAILIDSPQLAANYENEFKQMFTLGEFGPAKTQGAVNPVLDINGTRVQNYFSPQDKIESKLVSLVSSAKQSIYFMAFQFTEADLGSAMAARAQAGVTVSGVFETTGSQTQFSQYGKLKKLGLPVYQDGNPYLMHHKVIIVDEKTVVLGSYNFSSSAEKSNDENILIIDDPTLAASFLEEFNYVRGVALNPIR